MPDFEPTDQDIQRQTSRLHLILATKAGKEAIKRLGYIHESVFETPSYAEQKHMHEEADTKIPSTYVDDPRHNEEI